MKKIISIIFITVILNSCGSVSNFFGGEDIDKDRIQGDRISILSLERNLSSDPQLRDNKVIIPAIITITILIFFFLIFIIFSLSLYLYSYLNFYSGLINLTYFLIKY